MFEFKAQPLQVVRRYGGGEGRRALQALHVRSRRLDLERAVKGAATDPEIAEAARAVIAAGTKLAEVEQAAAVGIRLHESS